MEIWEWPSWSAPARADRPASSIRVATVLRKMWEVMSGVPGGGEGVLELVVDVRRVAQRADGRGEDDVEVAPVRPEPDRRDVSPAVHHVGRTSVRYPASLLGSG